MNNRAGRQPEADVNAFSTNQEVVNVCFSLQTEQAARASSEESEVPVEDDGKF
jgi:hypothetical protein